MEIETAVEEPGISEMLAGESQQSDASDNTQAPEGGKPEKITDLHKLAEKLSMKVEDLYDIEFSYADGKKLSLGKLKDSVVKQDDLTARELELEQRRTKQEAEITRASSELELILKSLPDNAISAKAREQISQRHQINLQREAELTRQAIPDWENRELREKELTGMAGMLEGEYGFPKDYLKSAFNHRVIRLVRDHYRLKSQVDAALAQVKKRTKPSTTGKSAPAGAPAKGGTGTAKQVSARFAHLIS